MRCKCGGCISAKVYFTPLKKFRVWVVKCLKCNNIAINYKSLNNAMFDVTSKIL